MSRSTSTQANPSTGTTPVQRVSRVTADALLAANRELIQSIRDDHIDLDEEPLSSVADYAYTSSVSVTSYVDHITRHLVGRIIALEALVFATNNPQPPPASSASTPQQTSTTQRSSLPRTTRCAKCHARGHDTASCHTANPAAMRTRVARNTRIAGESRAYHAAPAIPLPAPPYPLYQLPPTPFLPAQANIASLSADATELRRRTAQSKRDKRLHARRATSAT